MLKLHFIMLEPIGSAKPTFSTKMDLYAYREMLGQSMAISCPASTLSPALMRSWATFVPLMVGGAAILMTSVLGSILPNARTTFAGQPS